MENAEGNLNAAPLASNGSGVSACRRFMVAFVRSFWYDAAIVVGRCMSDITVLKATPCIATYSGQNGYAVKCRYEMVSKMSFSWIKYGLKAARRAPQFSKR